MLAISELFCGVTHERSGAMSRDLKMADARLIESVPYRDVRGSFEVFWEANELADAGIDFEPSGNAFSYNEKVGTLRGMHYQKTPFGQAKLVSCVNGRVLDVIADLRPESPTYLRWAATELSAASGRAIFIPSGYAHGFVSLTDHATLAYLIEGDYQPQAAGIVRWNDPSLNICWPVTDPILAERDRLAPDFLA